MKTFIIFKTEEFENSLNNLINVGPRKLKLSSTACKQSRWVAKYFEAYRLCNMRSINKITIKVVETFKNSKVGATHTSSHIQDIEPMPTVAAKWLVHGHCMDSIKVIAVFIIFCPVLGQ